jgi:hypothetical protein
VRPLVVVVVSFWRNQKSNVLVLWLVSCLSRYWITKKLINNSWILSFFFFFLFGRFFNRMSEDMMNGVGAPKTSAPPSPPIHRSGADNEAGSAGIAEAIFVRNACKSYGVGKRRSTVLRGLDMNVKKGTM